jgi:5-methylthioadenosine/S-adenosylhomocysteine deaminase
MKLRQACLLLETPDRFHDLWIDRGKIQRLEPHRPEDASGENVSDTWVLPGLVNAHTHVAMQVMKSLFPQQPDAIQKFMIPLESNLTEEDVYAFARLGFAECLLGGSTLAFDHYYFAEAVAQAAKDVGIRAAIAPTLMDRGPFPLEQLWNHAEGFFKGPSHPLIYKVLGPHATDTVGPDLFKKILDSAQKHSLPIHLHVSQTHLEFDFVRKTHHKSPVRWLREIGTFEHPTLLAHAIYLDPGDLECLSHPNVTLAICPYSLVLFDKLSPILDFYRSRIPFVLGTDCCACNDTMDLPKEARALLTLLRSLQNSHDPVTVPDPQLLWNAMTLTPYRWLNHPGLTGEIKPGSAADLIFIDKHALNLTPMVDRYWSLVMNLQPENIRDVMVAGQFVVKNRELQLQSRGELIQSFHRQRRSFLKRAGITKEWYA